MQFLYCALKIVWALSTIGSEEANLALGARWVDVGPQCPQVPTVALVEKGVLPHAGRDQVAWHDHEMAVKARTGRQVPVWPSLGKIVKHPCDQLVAPHRMDVVRNDVEVGAITLIGEVGTPLNKALQEAKALIPSGLQRRQRIWVPENSWTWPGAVQGRRRTAS